MDRTKLDEKRGLKMLFFLLKCTYRIMKGMVKDTFTFDVRLI